MRRPVSSSWKEVSSTLDRLVTLEGQRASAGGEDVM